VSGRVEVSTSVAAAPEVVYALVTDLARMKEWSPEATSVTWLDGATGPAPGARFRGANRNGVYRWSTTCTVVTADPSRELSFRTTWGPLSVALWRYRLAPDGSGGTRLTESTDDERGFGMKVIGVLGTGVVHRAAHNEETMRATLAAIKAAAEASAASAAPA
jgi:uncharacterized protein YndB with AHSA1/START domain